MNPYPKLLEKHNVKATEERLADVRETIHQIVKNKKSDLIYESFAESK
jgi:hypothetical protein